jgi:PhnB protein
MPSQVSYQPTGYQSVIPYLHVTGAAKMIAFMKDVFGAQEIAIYPRPDGTVGHAALRVGDSVIELADAGAEWPAMPCALQVYVPDAESTYHRALKAGATSLLEPAKQFYGDLTASVKDTCGNNWYIATQVEVISKEEVDKRIAAMAHQHSHERDS